MCEVETKLIEQVNPTQLAELISKGQLVEIKNTVSAGLSKAIYRLSKKHLTDSVKTVILHR